MGVMYLEIDDKYVVESFQGLIFQDKIRTICDMHKDIFISLAEPFYL